MAGGQRKGGKGDRRSARWTERVIVGALLGAALFAVEAGLGQIALGRDAACRQAEAAQRLPAPETNCLPETGSALARSLTYGPGGRVFPTAAPWVAWIASAGLYALLGGVCAQLTLGWAVGTFLGVHLMLVGAVAFFTYIAKYVTF